MGESRAGTDGRLYPWGQAAPGRQLCNYNMEVGGTTPVGLYSPAGDSPYECADMAGNVWEWTRSQFKGYPYQADDGREDGDASAERVVRGGPFNGRARIVRCAFRNYFDPLLLDPNVGFRVCAVPVRWRR